MKIPLYQIDAFAEKVFQGNPAAVCPMDAWLPDDTLQSIAHENNLSETAFLVKSGGHYDLRWFTPQSEVDLCGHATLAAAFVLFEKHGVAGNEVAFQTRSGTLKVRRNEPLYTLDFPAQPGTECEPPEGLAEALGERPLAVLAAADYMAVFESQALISNMRPDFALLEKLDRRGVIVTAPGSEVDFVSRCFYPRLGVNEDPVTGSAHCTLAPYWSDRLGKVTLSARQISRRGGSLTCEVGDGRIFISGRAVLFLQGEIIL